jgi:hypothetical protein
MSIHFYSDYIHDVYNILYISQTKEYIIDVTFVQLVHKSNFVFSYFKTKLYITLSVYRQLYSCFSDNVYITAKIIMYITFMAL